MIQNELKSILQAEIDDATRGKFSPKSKRT